MLGADIDICPSCGEHTGMEEEECEECNGKGDREEQLTR
jgi:DnaJ-class molecular chaperone